MIRLTKNISSKQREWRNSPHINRWTRQNGILSERQMQDWRKKIEEDPSIQMFGVEGEISYNIDTQTAWEEVGTAGLTGISPMHGVAEFSLLIGPEYHRKGFGRRALEELLLYGFKNLRLNLIYGETFRGNPALALFLDLGMREEGILRERYFKDGAYTSTHMVSITAEEARRQKWWR